MAHYDLGQLSEGIYEATRNQWDHRVWSCEYQPLIDEAHV